MLDAAYDEGIRTFMCTTHDRVGLVCDHVRANPGRYAGFKFYPCMPYAHKYANAVTDHGMIGAAMHFMPDDGLLKTALRGGMASRSKDVEGLAKILVDMEMKMFRGLETPVIFLQNVVVDLLLGMGMKDALPHLPRLRAREIRRRAGLHHHEPADAARHARRGRDREPDRLRQHQQDRLPRLGRDRGLPGDAADPAGAGRSRCRCSPRARSRRARRSNGWPPRRASTSIVFGASSRKNIRDTKSIVDAAYA